MENNIKISISKTVIRLIPWLVPVAMVVSHFAALQALGEISAVAEARSHFFSGDFVTARDKFESLINSIWVGKEANTGLVLCNAILEGVTAGERQNIDTAPFALTPLMMRCLRAAEFDLCFRLAAVARAGGEGTASLFKAAALFEAGEREEALHIRRTLPQELHSCFLGERLRQAITLWQNDASVIVRDRNGVLVGAYGPSCEFQDLGNVVPLLVPETFLEEIKIKDDLSGVRLSVDLDLSRMAFDRLENVISQDGREGFGGSVVLLDAETGQILTAVSDEESSNAGDAPALEQRLEPASIIKLITVTAALRAGIDVDRIIADMECKWGNFVKGFRLWCPSHRDYDWQHHKKLSGLTEALAVSCNTAFARLGVMVGWQEMLEELRMFGFDAKTGNPFRTGRILLKTGDAETLANLAIGLDATDITPLHAALIAAPFANGGRLPDPMIIHSEDGSLGLTPSPYASPDGRQILKKEWLPQLIEAMSAVTGRGISAADGEWWWGTAVGVAPETFPVAMKTGTGGSRGRGFHINYIGVGPLPNPRVAFCVRITGKDKSHRVRQAGYELTKSLLQSLDRLAESRDWR